MTSMGAKNKVHVSVDALGNPLRFPQGIPRRKVTR